MGSEELSFTLDELRLAWRRVKSARPDRCFVGSTAGLRLVEQDRDGWLKDLREKLAGGYEPKPGRLCLVPKARSLLRPVVVLELDDEVAYTALLGRLLPHILGVLQEHQGDPDVAYQLAGDPGVPRWVRSDFPIWRQWRERSVKKLDEGYSYVLVADVAGFYDNIDLRRLRSDLKNLDADSQILDLPTGVCTDGRTQEDEAFHRATRLATSSPSSTCTASIGLFATRVTFTSGWSGFLRWMAVVAALLKIDFRAGW